MINCEHHSADPTWAAVMKQLFRLAHLEAPFGSAALASLSREALQDYMCALLTCDSLDEVTQVVDDYAMNESMRPTPADIRRKVYEAHNARNGGEGGRAIEEWKRDPLDHMQGIFTRGKHPALDEHLDALAYLAKHPRDPEAIAREREARARI